MSLELIAARCADVPAPDEASMRRARARMDDLTKPPGSLGRIEPLVVRICGMTGKVIPEAERAGALLFAADHGIAEDGLSAYEAKVTEEMVVNICMGGAVSSVLARSAGAVMRVVDVGVKTTVRHPAAIVRKVAPGTRHFLRERAMSREQAYACVSIGMEEADNLARQGIQLLTLGEMGIGNTTSSAAMAAVLLGVTAAEATGKGTGIDGGALQRKIAVIAQAVERHRPDPGDPWDVLSALGGFEIGALAGAMLAAASRRIPILLDGVITGVAALWATRICPRVGEYLIASHVSAEPAHARILAELGLEPFARWEMRLGEGSGALMMLPVIRTACRVMAETATFEDARVSNPFRPDSAAENDAADARLQVEGAPTVSGFDDFERRALYKAIAARRDIRSYLPDPIPDEALSLILQAAHRAPSVGYMQPWNFILIRDRSVIGELHRAVDRERVRASERYEGLRQDHYLRLKVDGLQQAPLVICVTNDSNRGGPHVLGRNTIPETDLMSTACAIENMWLAARVEGIAMGWISMYRKEDVRRILDIPEHIDPVALLTVGYTAHFPDIPLLERVGWRERLELRDLVFETKWNRREG